MVRVVTAIIASLLMGRTEDFQLYPSVMKAREIFHCLKKSHLSYYLLLMPSWLTIEQNK